MINGQDFDWESTTLRLPTGVVATITDIQYRASKEAESVYGRGSLPVAEGRGNHASDGTITMARRELQTIIDYASGLGVGIMDVPLFPITVSYGNNDEPVVTDTLSQCRITEVAAAVAQNDKSVLVTMPFINHDVVLFNGVPSASG